MKQCVRLDGVNEQYEKLVKTSVKMCVRLCETVCKTSVNEQCEKLVKTSVWRFVLFRSKNNNNNLSTYRIAAQACDQQTESQIMHLIAFFILFVTHTSINENKNFWWWIDIYFGNHYKYIFRYHVFRKGTFIIMIQNNRCK